MSNGNELTWMVWLYEPNLILKASIEKAIEHYQEKYGQRPNRAQVGLKWTAENVHLLGQLLGGNGNGSVPPVTQQRNVLPRDVWLTWDVQREELEK